MTPGFTDQAADSRHWLFALVMQSGNPGYILGPGRCCKLVTQYMLMFLFPSSMFFSHFSLCTQWIFLPYSIVQQGAASLDFACCKFVQGHAQQRPCWAAFVIPAVNNEDKQQASTE